MAIVTAIVVGVIFASGVYLVMRRSMFDVFLGIALLGQSVNLLIIAAGGWAANEEPPYLTQEARVVVVEGEQYKITGEDPAHYADPLPQALILTAIVISFAMLAFAMVLMARNYETSGSIEIGEMAPEELAKNE